MKKKIRVIRVEGEKFFWSVTEDYWPEGRLRIWRSDTQANPWIISPVSVEGPITPKMVAQSIRKARSVASLLRAQLDAVGDSAVRRQIERLSIVPRLEHRDWEYGNAGDVLPCWFVLEHEESNTGIAYCEHGFGPQNPWGLMFLSGEHLSMGPDASWYSDLESAFVESMAYNEIAANNGADPNG